jgi:serine/threonine-protein kinase
MNFEIGKTYNGYEFLDVLRMSKTQVDYRVWNRLAQRVEVLTVLPGNLQSDQEQMERFLREMKVHARLVHPNIIGFYNAMELERQAVMTTELVEGVTLKERLQAGPLGWTEAIGYIRQALAALSYAHSQKTIHRDITPESMMITPEAVVKLSGFGLAKSATSPQLTQVGVVVGNLKYISPEQIKGSGALDPRADLYSVGVVLYEAITGKPPFESSSSSS